MYLLCHICEQEIRTGHVCKQEDIERNISFLKKYAREAETQLRKIQDTVLMTIQSLPSLETEEILVKSEWLKKLWEVSKSDLYDNNVENFLAKWVALHRILTSSFRLFKPQFGLYKKSRLEKLRDLKEACISANEVFGYNSEINLNPEDVCQDLLTNL